MVTLPPEILHKIFIQIDLQERLSCLTVCRCWWRVLDKYSLFYNVDLYQHDSIVPLFRFLINFRKKPEYAAQVEELDIFLKTNDCLIKRELLKTFPNVRVIRSTRTFDTKRTSPKDVADYYDMSFSTSKLESLQDYDHCEIVSQMLYSYLGVRLKTLDLDFACISGTPSILSQLKYLPVLKALTLRSLKITVDILEKIHANLPSLEDFSLYFATLGAGILPTNVIPATSIRKFTFNTGDFTHVNTHCQFYRYIANKYINLTEINHEDKVLEYYCDNYRKQIYLDGFLDFLKLISPIKKEITFFGVPDGVNPFDALDSVDTRIDKLYFKECLNEETFQYLSQSKLANYITTLEFFNTRVESMCLLQTMANLTSITVFSIDPNQPPVRLADCLDGCPPSLKSLAITARNVAIEPFHTQLHSIENLEIGFYTLTSDLCDIISNCFPNLVTFKLTGKILHNIHITLKSPRFQEAQFFTEASLIPDHSTYAFAFKSPKQSETQYYINTKKGNAHEIVQRKRVQYDDIAHLPILAVESLRDSRLETDLVLKIVSC